MFKVGDPVSTDGTPTCFVRILTRDLFEHYLAGREVDLI